jgi:hypothetical protein
VKRDELVGQQLEGPRGLAWRGRTAPQGNQESFFGAIEETLARGLHLLFSHQSSLEPLFDKTLTDVTDRIAMTVEGLGHVGIGPVGAVGLYVQ